MDQFASEQYLRTKSRALRAALRERRLGMGSHQARLYYAMVYTDDFGFFNLGAFYCAVGMHLWRAMCFCARLWMSPKVGAGSIMDIIGARVVLNGGFGCFEP